MRARRVKMAPGGETGDGNGVGANEIVYEDRLHSENASGRLGVKREKGGKDSEGGGGEGKKRKVRIRRGPETVWNTDQIKRANESNKTKDSGVGGR